MFDMDRTLLEVETASLYVRYQRQIGGMAVAAQVTDHDRGTGPGIR